MSTPNNQALNDTAASSTLLPFIKSDNDGKSGPVFPWIVTAIALIGTAIFIGLIIKKLWNDHSKRQKKVQNNIEPTTASEQSNLQSGHSSDSQQNDRMSSAAETSDKTKRANTKASSIALYATKVVESICRPFYGKQSSASTSTSAKVITPGHRDDKSNVVGSTGKADSGKTTPKGPLILSKFGKLDPKFVFHLDLEEQKSQSESEDHLAINLGKGD